MLNLPGASTSIVANQCQLLQDPTAPLSAHLQAVHRSLDLRERMTEADIEIILERGRRPEARPRIISDNGPQFIAKDFKEFIRNLGPDAPPDFAVLSPIERKNRGWHKSLKSECIRAGTPLSFEDAQRLVEGYVDHYNNGRRRELLALDLAVEGAANLGTPTRYKYAEGNTKAS